MQTSLLHRHPELVSGSIAVFAWRLSSKPNRAIGSFHAPTRPSAKWTLKQVQGDELGLTRFVRGAVQ